MKRFLCLLLVLILVPITGTAASKVTYKTDKFFLQLDPEWEEVKGFRSDDRIAYARTTNGRYDMEKGYIMLMEFPDSTSKKGSQNIEQAYLELFKLTYTLTKEAEIIATETITVNGKDKDVLLCHIEELGDTMDYVYMTTIAGNGCVLLVIFGNASVKNPKVELAELLESIVAR